jgi:hypothetical protein
VATFDDHLIRLTKCSVLSTSRFKYALCFFFMSIENDGNMNTTNILKSKTLEPVPLFSVFLNVVPDDYCWSYSTPSLSSPSLRLIPSSSRTSPIFISNQFYFFSFDISFWICLGIYWIRGIFIEIFSIFFLIFILY